MSNHTLDASGVKVCPRCGETKSREQFGVIKSGRDAGYSRSWCKACERVFKRGKREHYNELESARRAECREEYNARMVQYNAIHKDKVAARNAVNNAIIAGRLERADTHLCGICGQRAEQYHHANGYAVDHYFDVIPVCRKCHEREHHLV